MEQLTYEQALRLKGEIIRFKNREGKWAMGRVANVRKDGLEIEELGLSNSEDGYGYGLWGPFWGRPFFYPFGFPFFFW